MANRAVTRELAQYIAGLKYDDLPPDVIEAAKEVLIDQAGVMLAGSTFPGTRPVYSAVSKLRSPPESTVVGYGTKMAPLHAAMINATFGHSCEYDDAILAGGHPGSLTVPPALALAEVGHRSGKDVLLAIVAGYEVAYRISLAMLPIIEIGYHPVGVVGPFLAATAASKMLGLNGEEMVHALSIAGSHSSGTMEYDQRGGEVKRYHAGMAVNGGMMAVLLTREGLTAPDTILEGLRGIPRLFARVEDATPIVEKLGQGPWGIHKRLVKLYPCVGSIHAAIQALAGLMVDYKFGEENIQAIDVWLSPTFIKHGASIDHPKDALGAQFSLSFTLALQAMTGKTALSDYIDSKRWDDPRILALMKKVQAHPEPGYAGQLLWASRVVVTLGDGREVRREVLRRKGVHDPVTRDELKAKYRTLAPGVIGAAQAERLLDTIERIETVDDVSQIIPLLVKEGRPITI